MNMSGYPKIRTGNNFPNNYISVRLYFDKLIVHYHSNVSTPCVLDLFHA
jgi:hypothetical protein